MKTFTCRHQIDCSAEEFWDKVHFGGFNRALYGELLGFGYEILEDDRDSGLRRTKIVPVVDAPRVLLKAFGEKTSFEEQGQFEATDPESQQPKYHFKIVPAAFTDKITIHGAMVIEPIDENRCWRSVTFNIGCRVFGIGGIFEHFVSAEIQRSYVRSAAFTNEYIKR